MSDNKVLYGALTVRKNNGATYWTRSYESVERLNQNLESRLKNVCDILIYKIDGDNPIELVETRENVHPKN